MNPAGRGGGGQGHPTGPCYCCKSTLHTIRDCPFRYHCYRCGSNTHLVRDCRMSPRADERRPFKGCRCCGDDGHWRRSCDMLNGMRGQGRDYSGVRICRVCRQEGHWFQNCPQQSSDRTIPHPQLPVAQVGRGNVSSDEEIESERDAIQSNVTQMHAPVQGSSGQLRQQVAQHEPVAPMVQNTYEHEPITNNVDKDQDTDKEEKGCCRCMIV